MRLLLYIITPLVLISCGEKEPLTPAEYIVWVSDPANDLHQIKTISKISYEAQYKPLEFIVANELKSKEISAIQMEDRKKELEGLHYFNFRIHSHTGGDVLTVRLNDEQQYFDRVNYCSFQMQYDFKLVAVQDTLPCMLYNFVRTHGVAPYVEFVLAFEKRHESPEDLQLLYEDKLFGTGLLKFTIADKSIKNIPEIITQ